MKNIIRTGLLTLSVAALFASCAEYNDTSYFPAEPDPTFVEPYKDYNPVKSYIDREKYPNMRLGATLKVSDFNKQELAHAAAITNFDNLSFGTTLMSGAIINAKGVMNFLDMKDLLDHVDELGAEVFGSPIVANSGQADDWLNMLTAPIKIPVEAISDKEVNYSQLDSFTGTVLKKGAKDPDPAIIDLDGVRCLEAKNQTSLYVIEGFDVDPELTYDITLRVKASKAMSLTLKFSDKSLDDKLSITEKWKDYTFSVKPTSTEGYLLCDPGRFSNGSVYYAVVKVVHFPDNHRKQTAQELSDTINYALNAWCDGLMKINKGRIKMFDLLEDAIDVTSTTEDGYYDLKHSTDKIFWQDILGSENYAPVVADVARKAFEKYDGNVEDLKLFVSESDLDNEKKFESLKHWINIWDGKGAKIEGISAKLTISYYEDEAKQAAKKAAVDKLLDNLASTGKLIRLSNFDVKYTDADGVAVKATDITEEQRQKLADYYAYIIKSYMEKIPNDKQAGICKGNMADTSDPVGLWAVENKDWVRTATYKAFCDVLSGK